MPIILAIILAAAALPAAAYLYWRLRYGPPPAGSVPILAYHKVDPRFELGGTRTTPAQFARQLRRLKDAGFESLTLSQAVAPPRAGGRPAKPVCLTFDDAYQDFATHAWPELSRQGFTATVFALTDYVGAENTWDINWLGLRFRHLDWDALRRLAAAGIEIGSHGASHRDLRHLDDAELEREVAGSKRILERELGMPVRTFCYPFGRYDARVRRAVERAGYAAACSLAPPRRNRAIDPLALRRCGVYLSDTAWSVRRKADHASPWFWTQDLFSRGVNFCAGGAALARRLFRAPHRGTTDDKE
ncbi:MAG: polysaccharide deacetylase family protein [Candidatus Edwardsbacteria bacterium]|nr:polysaccharide deacetylase family protein [Candidatus Edwardsbacteria bacterium]